MEKLFNKCRKIYKEKYLEDGDTMIATTSVLQELQQELDIIEVQDSRLSYKSVSNGSHALSTKSVTYKSSKTARDEFDTAGICTESGNAV